MRRFRYRRTYYPRQRTAYGPHHPTRPRQHVHMAAEWAFSAHELRALADWLTFAESPMPRGGARLMVYCPLCGMRRARLYATPAHFYPFECRCCAGLVYWRQYEGRRLEAAEPGAMNMPARALWAVGRYRGWQDALAVWKWRALEHSIRADMALTLNQLEWARCMAWCRRLDDLNAAVLARQVATPRAYLTALRQSPHTAEMIRFQQRIREMARQQHKPQRKAA